MPSIASSASTRILVGGHRDAMKPDRVWPVGRARGEHPGEREAFVVPGVHLQDRPVGLMQPREDDQLSAGRDPVQRRRELRIDLEGRLGAALERLTGRVATVPKGRSHDPDRRHLDRCCHGLMLSIPDERLS